MSVSEEAKAAMLADFEREYENVKKTLSSQERYWWWGDKGYGERAKAAEEEG